MSLTKLFAFNTPANYAYNPLEIVVENGVAKLVSNLSVTSATFEELFSTDTGFTYDVLKAEFVGGKVQQIQKAYKPTYYLGTFFADYDSDLDGNYGDGVLTGTPVGTPVITGNKLDLTSGGSYVQYNADLNADHQQFGCIRFKYTPNYAGSPGANQIMITIFRSAGSLVNLVQLYHDPTGNLILTVYDGSAAPIMGDVSLGNWVQVSGTEYELELNWDITAGSTRLFIDGTQFGATQVQTGTRSTDINLLNIGADYNGGQSPNAYFADVQMFNYPQHTANYVPSAYGLDDPKQPTFYAGYDEDVDGDWGEGVLTGTLVGGAAVSGGLLDLRGGTLKYAEYASPDNFSATQTGCIRLRWTPNYSGAPVTSANIFDVSDGTTNVNRLALAHASSNSEISFGLFDSSGIPIYTTNFFGVWSPVAGTEYEIELNWDITAGSTRLFVDGVQFGTTKTDTGLFSLTGQTVLRIGTRPDLTTLADFQVNDVLVFDKAQHVATYTPDWTGIQAYEYEASKVELPQFTYSGLGSILSFTNFVTTEAGAPKYVINDLYYSGGWVASNGSYAQSNTSAEILAQIATLPLSDTVNIDINFPNTIGTISDVDLLQLTYTGNIITYPTTNPIIAPISTLGMDALQIFTEATTLVGADAIKYILSKDGVKYYYSGGWVVSDGTYAQSNTAAEITAQIATFTVTGTDVTVEIFLHSDTGLTTPEIDSLSIGYDFGPAPLPVHQTILWWDGMFSNKASDTVVASITLNNHLVGYGEGVAIRKQTFIITPVLGRYEIALVDTATMDRDSKGLEQTYILKIGKTKYSINIPAQESVNLYDTGIIVG